MNPWAWPPQYGCEDDDPWTRLPETPRGLYYDVEDDSP